MAWRINDLTLMLCLFTSVCWPSFSFTTMRSLTIVSGPYSDNTRLHNFSFSDPHLCAVRPRDARSCSVFLSSQWRAQRLTSETSTSMKINRSSLTPVHFPMFPLAFKKHSAQVSFAGTPLQLQPRTNCCTKKVGFYSFSICPPNLTSSPVFLWVHSKTELCSQP